MGHASGLAIDYLLPYWILIRLASTVKHCGLATVWSRLDSMRVCTRATAGGLHVTALPCQVRSNLHVEKFGSCARPCLQPNHSSVVLHTRYLQTLRGATYVPNYLTHQTPYKHRARKGWPNVPLVRQTQRFGGQFSLSGTTEDSIQLRLSSPLLDRAHQGSHAAIGQDLSSQPLDRAQVHNI